MLSKHESGQGEQDYKRVTSISFDEEQPVRIVRFYAIDPSMSQGGRFDQVITTANHPFWVRGSGWTRADELGRGLEVDLHDGLEDAGIFCSAPLVKTENPNIAWAEGLFAEANDSSGELVFFEGNSFRIGSESRGAPEGM